MKFITNVLFVILFFLSCLLRQQAFAIGQSCTAAPNFPKSSGAHNDEYTFAKNRSSAGVICVRAKCDNGNWVPLSVNTISQTNCNFMGSFDPDSNPKACTPVASSYKVPCTTVESNALNANSSKKNKTCNSNGSNFKETTCVANVGACKTGYTNSLSNFVCVSSGISTGTSEFFTNITLPEINPSVGDNSWSTWRDENNPYWIVTKNCTQMKNGHMKALKYILKEAYYGFKVPTGGSRTIYILDLNERGSCYGHPGSTHTNGQTVDFNYYTLLENNYTQRVSGVTNTTVNRVVENINGVPTLIESKFDWERNYLLFKKIIEVFPKIRIMVHDVIWFQIFKKIEEKYGRTYALDFMKPINRDNSTSWNHEHHTHIDLGDEINWSYFKKVIYFPLASKDKGHKFKLTIVNNNSGSFSGKLYPYSNDSSVVMEDGIQINLSAYGKREIEIDSAFNNPRLIDYLGLKKGSYSDNVSGAIQIISADEYRSNYPAVSTFDQDTLRIPKIASDGSWRTKITFFNPNYEEINSNLYLNNSNTKISFPVKARTSKTYLASQLFKDFSNVDSFIVGNTKGKLAVIVEYETTSQSGLKYHSAQEITNSGVNELYFPHIASTSSWWTAFVLYNTYAQNQVVTLTSYSGSGTVLDTKSVTVSNQSNFVTTFKELNFNSNTAWIKAKSSHPINGLLSMGYDKNAANGLSVNNSPKKVGVLPIVEKTGLSGIVLLNPSALTTTISLTAYSDNGQAIKSINVNLNSNAKYANTIVGAFGSISNIGYLRYSSTQPILGYLMNGVDGAYFDGMNAL